MNLIFFVISFGASIVGSICGIGGGVIIKPLLDTFHVLSVSAISFLSGVTVLSMSIFSIGSAMLAGDSKVNLKISTPLAAGAVIGGILGKSCFNTVSGFYPDKDTIGAIQALLLCIITIGTLAFTIKKGSIKTLSLNHLLLNLILGLVLGILSSFLGIGGGPINLVVLSFFFSMQTKEAAQNSLYIILFSQLASLLQSVLSGNVPEFEPSFLVFMILGGILGAVIGRRINKHISVNAVNKLFVLVMCVIILINLYNIYQFAL